MKTKNLLYTLLGLIGLMGIAIGVVRADTTVTHNPDAGITYTLNGNEDFSAGTITITDGATTITMLDRNLGATQAGIGCENYYDDTMRYRFYCNIQSQDPTYGYHFQWGNNYGFNIYSEPDISNQQVLSGNITTPYMNSTFIEENENWLNDNSLQLRGGKENDKINSLSGDNWKVYNSLERQGPCPEGFHVPSYGELLKMQAMMGNDVSNIHNGLKIPFAGYRGYYNVSIIGYGGGANLWSSSNFGGRSAYLYINSDPNYISISDTDAKSNAYSIRCFYDDYDIYNADATCVGQHIEDGGELCMDNRALKQCTKGLIPDNSSYDIKDVVITYDKNGGGRSTPDNCDFICDDGYIKGAYSCTKITHYTGSNIDYYLNSGTDAAKEFTGVGTITITDGVNTITILDRNLGAIQAGIGRCIKNYISCDPEGWRRNGYSSHEACVQDGSQSYWQASGYSSWDECVLAMGDEDPEFIMIPEDHICSSRMYDVYGYSEFDGLECVDWDERGNCSERNTWQREMCGGGSFPGFQSYEECEIAENEYNSCLRNNTGLYGYYFQWGNNYGFAGDGEIQKENSQVSGSLVYPGYISGVFHYGGTYWDWEEETTNIRFDNWIDDNSIVNLWGGTYGEEAFYGLNGDNWKLDADSAINRQGPCPDGFHVPWGLEWQKVRDMTASSWGNMPTELMIPRNGIIRASLDGDIRPSNFELSPYLRTSTPFGTLEYPSEYSMGLGVNVVDAGRTNGMGIRCFYNEYDEYPQSVSIITISFNTNGGEGEISSQTIEQGFTVSRPDDPRKDGYKFDYWYIEGDEDNAFDFDSPITSDIILYAHWTKLDNKFSGYSGGGGRTRSDNTQDKNTENVIQSETKGSEESSNTPMDSSDKSSEGQTYTQEFQQAYQFAHKNGITTMDSIDKADMEGGLTRIAMAKMLSQYAMNVLGKKPVNIAVPEFKDVTAKLDEEYGNGVTLAYQLGIMGINMPDNKFRPFDLVPRSEFVTALSRMRYGTSDGEYQSTSKYYVPHMSILKEKGIVTNDNPYIQELRGYVMIMLMRSTK